MTMFSSVSKRDVIIGSSSAVVGGLATRYVLPHVVGGVVYVWKSVFPGKAAAAVTGVAASAAAGVANAADAVANAAAELAASAAATPSAKQQATG